MPTLLSGVEIHTRPTGPSSALTLQKSLTMPGVDLAQLSLLAQLCAVLCTLMILSNVPQIIWNCLCRCLYNVAVAALKQS